MFGKAAIWNPKRGETVCDEHGYSLLQHQLETILLQNISQPISSMECLDAD